MAKQQKDSILIERFWDTYDFTDTIRLSSSATTEKMLVDYLSQLSELTEERACENIRRLVLKTKVNKVVTVGFYNGWSIIYMNLIRHYGMIVIIFQYWRKH